jgi:hypothetical protein
VGLKIENAIRSELRITGTQKQGRFVMRRTFYTFICKDCSTEFTPVNTDLKRASGRCRACADLNTAKINRNRSPEVPYKTLYNKFIYDRSRDVRWKPCDISFEDFLGFTKIKQCHYCNSEIFWAAKAIGRLGQKYNLDRKDNNLGYLKSNVVVCCWRCNETKSDRFTYEQFLKIGEVLKTFDS